MRMAKFLDEKTMRNIRLKYGKKLNKGDRNGSSLSNQSRREEKENWREERRFSKTT